MELRRGNLMELYIWHLYEEGTQLDMQKLSGTLSIQDVWGTSKFKFVSECYEGDQTLDVTVWNVLSAYKTQAL